MTETIDLIAARVQVHAAACGAKQYPTYPPDQAAAYPFSAVFPGAGAWTGMSGEWAKALETIVCEIHIQRRNLAVETAAANAFAWALPKLILADPTLGGLVDTVIEVRRSSLQAMAWAGTDTIGYRFEIDYKAEPEI